MNTENLDDISASEESEITWEENPREIDQNLAAGRMNAFSMFEIYIANIFSETKFMSYEPDAQKANEKRLETNRKRREGAKRKKEEMDEEKLADKDMEKPAKKQKGLEAGTRQKVTLYVEIQAQAARSKPSKKADVKPISKRGPSFFTVDDNFDTFKQIVSKAIPCKLKLLPVDQMQWRYEKPGNDPKKPLTTEEGFEAMTLLLGERKSGFVVYISIPPPKADDNVSCTHNSIYMRSHLGCSHGTLAKAITSINPMTILKKFPRHLRRIYQRSHR
jgi:hypothetical protein